MGTKSEVSEHIKLLHNHPEPGESFTDWVCGMIDCPLIAGDLRHLPDDVKKEICSVVDLYSPGNSDKWSCVPRENGTVSHCWKKLYEYLQSVFPEKPRLLAPLTSGMCFIEWFCDNLYAHHCLCPLEVDLLDDAALRDICDGKKDYFGEWDCSGDRRKSLRCWSKLWECINIGGDDKDVE